MTRCPDCFGHDLNCGTCRGAGRVDAEQTRAPGAVREPPPHDRTMQAAKTRHFIAILRETGGNRSKAARILGVDRRTIQRWASQLEKGEGIA